MLKSFNLIIAGIGGQGTITLTRILAEAALIQGYDIKTSEVRGLAQRGGSVEAHIRFGEKIYAPLIKQGGANLIIALEIQEAVNACFYTAKKSRTIFLINDFLASFTNNNNNIPVNKQKILKTIAPLAKKIILIPASEMSQREIGSPILAGIILIGCGCLKNLLPLKTASILQAIKKVIPAKHLSVNLKALSLAKNV